MKKLKKHKGKYYGYYAIVWCETLSEKKNAEEIFMSANNMASIYPKIGYFGGLTNEEIEQKIEEFNK